MDIGWLCRGGVRKIKAQLKLNLARDAENNKKGFYKCVSQKRKMKERVPPHDEQDWQTGNDG